MYTHIVRDAITRKQAASLRARKIRPAGRREVSYYYAVDTAGYGNRRTVVVGRPGMKIKTIRPYGLYANRSVQVYIRLREAHRASNAP